MSKVRINDLAREMEVKSRQILDILAELGLAAGKTHSSSLEADEAQKVRAQFERGSRSAGTQAPRASQGIVPKIDLSHISKPGDVLKAILAKKQEQEAGARHKPVPPPAVTAVPPPAHAPAHSVAPAATAVAPPAAQDFPATPLGASYYCPSSGPARHCHPSAGQPGGRQGPGSRCGSAASGGCRRAARGRCCGQAAGPACHNSGG
jgi:translation initiation factor IF-2